MVRETAIHTQYYEVSLLNQLQPQLSQASLVIAAQYIPVSPVLCPKLTSDATTFTAAITAASSDATTSITAAFAAPKEPLKDIYIAA